MIIISLYIVLAICGVHLFNIELPFIDKLIRFILTKGFKNNRKLKQNYVRYFFRRGYFGSIFNRTWFFVVVFCCLPVECGLNLLYILSCCYISYEIECYMIVCSQIGDEKSKWSVLETLKKLSLFQYKM